MQRKDCGQMIEIEKPYVADLYTLKMSVVDHADQLQLRSYNYTSKWYQYVFWFLVNVCMCNAHILECIYWGRNSRKPLQFCMALAKQLINNFCQRKRPAPSLATWSPLQYASAKFEGRKGQCVQCKVLGRKMEKCNPVETKNKCMQCRIALCPVPCFREYHNNVSNWVGCCFEFADVLISFCIDFLIFLIENFKWTDFTYHFSHFLHITSLTIWCCYNWYIYLIVQ